MKRIKQTLAAGLIGLALLTGCSKEPAPPVVINLSNGSQTQVPATATGPKGQTAAAYSRQQVSIQPTQGQPVVQSVNFQAPAPRPYGLTGSNQPAVTGYTVEHLDEASFFNTQIHEMALQLMNNFRDDTGPDGPIVVTTFVDLNNLYRTSPFGRYIAEQLMGELQRAGFSVVEVRKTDSVMIKPRYGEYGLSRDIQEIARQSAARYVLTGTYVTKGRYVLVNARLVSNENNMVASSGLKILRRDPFIEKMLWPSSTPEAAPEPVHVPLKELGSISDVKILSGS